jgi:hypothetical protein
LLGIEHTTKTKLKDDHGEGAGNDVQEGREKKSITREAGAMQMMTREEGE